MTANPQIPLEDIPDGSQLEMYFLDSSWFRTHGRTNALPTPEQVRLLSDPKRYRHLVRFEELNLIVKYGPEVSTIEAINVWAIQKAFQNQVPAPEVYGWRIDHRDGKPTEVFIYMQLIAGHTLDQKWDSMLQDEKQAVCTELQNFVSRFRRFKQSESGPAVGSITHASAPDRCFESLPFLKPFPTRAIFHDWLSWLWRRHVPDPESIQDPWRDLLPDNGPTVFTHGDLRPANIIVTAANPVKIVAIVDWEQAGWYPDYWEQCKAKFTAGHDEDWYAWIDVFLEPHEAALDAFDFYTFTLGIL